MDQRTERSRAQETIGAEQLAAAGRWQLDSALLSFDILEISAAGQSQRVTPKAMSVLLALCQRAGQTLSRDELLDLIWPHDYPTQDVLSQAIRELRRALGEDSPAQSCIRTVPRVGYQLVATPRRLPVDATPAPASAGLGAPAALPARRPSAWRSQGLAAGAASAGCALALLLIAGVSRTSDRPAQIASATPRIELLTHSERSERQPSLSPDGRWLAHVEWSVEDGRARVVLTHLADGQRRWLDPQGGRDEYMPRWSHDGRSVAYQSADASQCEIRIIQPLQEPVPPARSLGGCTAQVYDPLAWAHDDQGLWIARPTEGSQVPQLVLRRLDGSERLLDYERQAGDWDLDPQPSPDGRWLVFRRGTHPRSDLFLVGSDGGKVRRLTDLDSYFGRVAWRPDSSAIVYSEGELSNRRLYVHTLANDEVRDLGMIDADFPEIAGNGQLVFERLRQRRVIGQLELSQPPASTPPELRRLAPSTGNTSDAVYAPDGQRIAFISDRSGSEQLWLQTDANRPPRRLSDWPPARLRDLSWSADGMELVVLRVAADGELAALALRIDGDRAQRSLLLPTRGIRHPRLLPRHRLAWLQRGERGWQAWWMDLAATDPTPTSVADLAGLEPAMQTDGETIYLTDPSRGEILRVEAPYQRARIVASGLPHWVPGRWRLAQGAVWYVWLDSQAQRSALYRAELPGPLTPVEVLDLGALRALPVFEISPLADRILIRQFESDQTDIALLVADR